MNHHQELVRLAKIESQIQDPKVVSLIINRNQILSKNLVEGIEAELAETAEGVDLDLLILEGVNLKQPIQLCFGILDQPATQIINLHLIVEKNARATIVGYCLFPHSHHVKHIMNGKITIKEGARYRYYEKHVHSRQGQIAVYPKAVVKVGKGARFKTDFELLRGRVGLLDVDYQITGDEDSRLELEVRVSGREDDLIKVKESAILNGARSRGVLKSRIAVRDRAQAEVYNSIIASGPHARGHIDCTEILQGQGTVRAYPNVGVLHPKAQVTHEASLGGVDNKQLETLMARGLTENEAEELIIEGLLS